MDYVGVTLICNLNILPFPCIELSDICPQFKTVLPAAVFSVDSKNALLHPSIGLLLSVPSLVLVVNVGPQEFDQALSYV